MGSMVKSSLKGSDFTKSGFGIQEGRVKLSDSEFTTIQRIKKDQTLVTPMMVLRTQAQKLDANNNPEGEPEPKDFMVCWGSKAAAENGLHTFAFHPCKADSPNDQDLEDLGNEDGTCEIGVSGPTFGAQKDIKPYEDSEISLFIKSLEAKNFSPAINAQCWAPNYDGLIIEVVTVKSEDLCKKFGVKFRPPQEGKESQTVWDVVKIIHNPHDKAGKKTAATTTAKQTVKTNGAAKPEPAAEEAGEAGGGESDRTEAQAKMDAVVKEFAAANKGKTMTVKEFQRSMSPKLVKAAGGGEAVKYDKAVFKTEGGLDTLAMLLDSAFEVDGDNVTFA